MTSSWKNRFLCCRSNSRPSDEDEAFLSSWQELLENRRLFNKDDDDDDSGDNDNNRLSLENKMTELMQAKYDRTVKYDDATDEINKVFTTMKIDRIGPCLLWTFCWPCWGPIGLVFLCTDLCCTNIHSSANTTLRRSLEDAKYRITHNKARRSMEDFEKLKEEFLKEEVRRLSELYVCIRNSGDFTNLQSSVSEMIESIDSKYNYIDKKMLDLGNDYQKSITDAEEQYDKYCHITGQFGPLDLSSDAEDTTVFIAQRIHYSSELRGSTVQF